MAGVWAESLMPIAPLHSDSNSVVDPSTRRIVVAAARASSLAVAGVRFTQTAMQKMARRIVTLPMVPARIPPALQSIRRLPISRETRRFLLWLEQGFLEPLLSDRLRHHPGIRFRCALCGSQDSDRSIALAWCQLRQQRRVAGAWRRRS